MSDYNEQKTPAGRKKVAAPFIYFCCLPAGRQVLVAGTRPRADAKGEEDENQSHENIH